MRDLIITFLASFLIWIMLFSVFLLWFMDGAVKREQAMHAVFASLTAWGIAQMIKTLLPVSRPFNINGSEVLTVTVPIDAAFPSVHAAVSFAIGAAIFFHNRAYGVAFLIAAIGVSLGRVLANVHFYQDVVAGAVIGIVVAYSLKKVHFKT